MFGCSLNLAAALGPRAVALPTVTDLFYLLVCDVGRSRTEAIMNRVANLDDLIEFSLGDFLA